MKAKVKWGATSLFAVALSLQCARAESHDGPPARRNCDASMLRGLYLFKGSGFASINGAAVPKAILGSVRFNGDGTLVAESLTVTILNLPPASVADSPGNYTVESDCTGTLTFPSGLTWNIFVASPTLVSQIQTGGPDHGVVQADARFISR
jgi:hypothetical protein